MKVPATGATAVTVGDDGSIVKEDGWGSDEGLTGVMFCTDGVARNYKTALTKKCPKKDCVHNTDHILQQAGGIINKNW
eukprot:8683659-Ditylum_brightwellii.AAC.1